MKALCSMPTTRDILLDFSTLTSFSPIYKVCFLDFTGPLVSSFDRDGHLLRPFICRGF